MPHYRDPVLADVVKALDGYRCRSCGWELGWDLQMLLEADHIVPLADGGLDTLENLQTLCYACHERKTGWENSKRSAPSHFSSL